MDEKEDRVMKEAREYITTIRKGLAIWEHWTKEGNTIISKHKESFPEIIRAETATIRQLNPQDVKDAILAHEDGIAMRIKRLDEYKLQAVVQYLIDTADTHAQLSDAFINSLIDEYRQTVDTKTAQLLEVIKECEKYIKPQNPIIAKAMANPLLLSYFYDNKKVMEEYINYCLSDTNKSMKAFRAKELANQGKIKMDCIKKPLHDELEKIGIDVGSYPNWQQAINQN